MNIMVLKRLLITALGALGLGALAAGPASAQQIPAPDLFDDQVECSSNVPAGTANAALGTALGTVIEDGETIEVGDDGSPMGSVAGLNYIIPPGNSNCGAGGATVDHDMMEDTPEVLVNTVSGAIAKDVATGYSETLTAFLDVRAQDAAVKTANKALDALLEDMTDDDLQTLLITTARETLAAAQLKQTAAHSKLYSVGAGPINMAGIVEWRAKFAVEDAVTAWNTSVAGLMTADTALNAREVEYADYVPLRNTAQIDGLVTDGVVNLAMVRSYANAEGNNSAVQDATSGDITNAEGSSSSGNFDGAGNLLIPKGDTDLTTEGVQLGLTTDKMSYMVISTRLESVGTTVTALKKLQGDNKNALLQPVIDEAVRRAEVEQAHYQMQFNEMVADETDLDDDDANGIESIMTLYGKYTAAKTARDNKGVELTTAFQAREMATSAVAAAFTDSQAFYQQLVDRRTYTKAQKEAEVTRLAGLTGDDAATETQTEAAADAVTAAEKALMAATDAQASFQDLVADDSPVKALVEELLKSDATGDDGGALVDAIMGAYAAPADNAERLDELLKETTTTTESTDDEGTVTTTSETTESGRIVDIEESIAGLTGTDGAVSMNTGRIAQNEDDITALDGRVTVNEGDIDANTTMIGENRTMIGTNVTNIAGNATNIMANTTAIGVERGRIDTNVMDIATNATGVMTNAGNIMANEMNITSNTASIGMNTSAIDANATNITANGRNISGNTAMIGELSESLEVVRAGVAASMALAGMPAINGRGISIGVGSFDGESAFAVGFQIQSDTTSFKVGVTSSGGATGASAGVGFQF